MKFHTRVLAEQPLDLAPPHPLYFVSDLHLGDGGRADDFAEGAHRDAFEWFLAEEVEEEGGELIILGDVFELWQCAIRRVRDHYGPLFWRLHNYRLLRGNHDASYGKPPEWRWPTGYHPLLLTEHGHQADPFNSSLGFVGRSVTALAGLLERLGWRDVDKAGWRWRWMPTPVTRPDRFPPGHYEQYAGLRARETGAKLVILGHTHRPALTRLPGGVLYANTGCWVSPHYAGSFLRLGDGDISLCRVTGDRSCSSVTTVLDPPRS